MNKFLLLLLFVCRVNASPDLDVIYNDTFSYSLPRTVLESYLSGKAFDNTDFYSQEESDRLKADIQDLFQLMVSANPAKEKLAVITAGAPGSGKTTQLRKDLKAGYAYICPDDVCLKNQARTYLADIQTSDGSFESRQTAYNKWRPGSNGATHLILANLIREGLAFYYGTTSSSPATQNFFRFLKEQGYRIKLLHLSAPDDVRWESIKERDKTFVQTTEQDIREKGLLLPQRINDTFKYADEVLFYYRNGVNESAVLAARWIKQKPGRTLEIVEQEAYEKIKAIHNAAIEFLKRPELRWEEAVEADSLVL